MAGVSGEGEEEVGCGHIFLGFIFFSEREKVDIDKSDKKTNKNLKIFVKMHVSFIRVLSFYNIKSY